jgi:hypothetical protein
MKKKLSWMFTSFILSASAFTQRITIKGMITDAMTGETLPAVNNELMLGIGQQGTKLNKVSIKTI